MPRKPFSSHPRRSPAGDPDRRFGDDLSRLPARALGPLCRVWTLRALVDLGALGEMSKGIEAPPPHLLQFVGVMDRSGPEAVESEVFDLGYNYRKTLLEARRRLREHAGRGADRIPSGSQVARNLGWLQRELGLDELQTRILLLCVMARRCVDLGLALSALGEISTFRLYSIVASILNVSVDDVRHSLRRDGALAASGLARVDEGADFFFQAKIDLLMGIDERLLTEAPAAGQFGLFASNFTLSEKPTLAYADFAHLNPRLDHLKAYLAHTVASRASGGNVLVYGPPGVGKTQLARVLADQLQFRLFEVAVASSRGDRIAGRQRLSAFELTQKILAKRPGSLVMFDEIEDIDDVGPEDADDAFPRFGKASPSGRKAWFNRLLETNPVPAIWISNSIRGIDPAHLRRFDFHLFLDTPPSEVRVRMLAEQTAALGTTDAWCRRLAAHTPVPPAVITRAARVVGSIREAGATTSAEELLEEVIGASLSAQRIGLQMPAPEGVDTLSYDIRSVNAIGADLEQLLGNLRRHPHARLLLWGKPGTGKSRYATYLAEQLGLPALLQRASDIVGPYVGETEQRIAAMFRRAQSEGAVLILDEADSFLGSRVGASQRYEVSAVNEMLVAIENFPGIFVATTNLLDRLDEACLRRFDLRIRFDYLTRAQVVALLRETCRGLGIDACEAESVAAELERMTPGDFAQVLRQARFFPVGTLQGLKERLQDAVRLRPEDRASRPIGFRLEG